MKDCELSIHNLGAPEFWHMWFLPQPDDKRDSIFLEAKPLWQTGRAKKNCGGHYKRWIFTDPPEEEEPAASNILNITMNHHQQC